MQGRQPGWSDEQYGSASFWARLVFDVGTSLIRQRVSCESKFRLSFPMEKSSHCLLGYNMKTGIIAGWAL